MQGFIGLVILLYLCCIYLCVTLLYTHLFVGIINEPPPPPPPVIRPASSEDNSVNYTAPVLTPKTVRITTIAGIIT